MKLSFALRVFIIALVVRLIPVILTRSLGIGLDDMFQYDMLARSIASGNGYRWYAQNDLYLVQNYFSTLNFQIPADYDPRGVLTSFRPPLYPVFIAFIYFITGVGAERYFIVRISQTVLSAALVPLTYFIARKVFPENEHAAKVSAWVIVFYPLLVIYPLSLATENLFFVLVLLSVLTLLKADETRAAKHFILSGILIGLAALTRSVFLAFGGLAVLWVFFALKEKQKAVLLFLIVSAVTLPWMIRNTLLHHHLTGIESALGYDLYVGYHPESTGTFQYGISLDMMPYLDDGVRDEIGKAKAFEFIRQDPGRIPYLMVRRLGYFFGLERRALTYFYSNDFLGYIPKPLLLLIAFIALMPFVIVSVSSALGISILKWNHKTLLLMLAIFGYLTPHILILGEDRFHLTLVPFLAILAAQFWAGGLREVSARWKGSLMGKVLVSLALCCVVLLLLNWGLELSRDADKIAALFGANGNQTYFPY
ncbi:MAG: glycosyltransferase family 39 protein [Chloroflexi bacterium]|nr:glycosyltransferase family 39 protein [Chloroflexota bacterium]